MALACTSSTRLLRKRSSSAPRRRGVITPTRRGLSAHQAWRRRLVAVDQGRRARRPHSDGSPNSFQRRQSPVVRHRPWAGTGRWFPVLHVEGREPARVYRFCTERRRSRCRRGHRRRTGRCRTRRLSCLAPRAILGARGSCLDRLGRGDGSLSPVRRLELIRYKRQSLRW